MIRVRCRDCFTVVGPLTVSTGHQAVRCPECKRLHRNAQRRIYAGRAHA